MTPMSQVCYLAQMRIREEIQKDADAIEGMGDETVATLELEVLLDIRELLQHNREIVAVQIYDGCVIAEWTLSEWVIELVVLREQTPEAVLSLAYLHDQGFRKTNHISDLLAVAESKPGSEARS